MLDTLGFVFAFVTVLFIILQINTKWINIFLDVFIWYILYWYPVKHKRSITSLFPTMKTTAYYLTLQISRCSKTMF